MHFMVSNLPTMNIQMQVPVMEPSNNEVARQNSEWSDPSVTRILTPVKKVRCSFAL